MGTQLSILIPLLNTLVIHPPLPSPLTPLSPDHSPDLKNCCSHLTDLPGWPSIPTPHSNPSGTEKLKQIWSCHSSAKTHSMASLCPVNESAILWHGYQAPHDGLCPHSQLVPPDILVSNYSCFPPPTSELSWGLFLCPGSPPSPHLLAVPTHLSDITLIFTSIRWTSPPLPSDQRDLPLQHLVMPWNSP